MWALHIWPKTTGGLARNDCGTVDYAASEPRLFHFRMFQDIFFYFQKFQGYWNNLDIAIN